VLDAEHQAALLAWYDEHQRALPWRATRDPWAILLSEVVLQQTQVSRGEMLWQRMMDRFPTVAAMAAAPVDDVLKAWEGAGYYSRARRLHALAQTVMAPSSEGGHDGIVPETYDALLALPGIGPYTAAAVASIAFEQPVACVDGNIRRVMARLTAQRDPSTKEVQAWADASIQRERPGDWNQALMELGATVCTAKKVGCERCSLRHVCAGHGTPEAYPTPRASKVKAVVWTAIVEVACDGLPLLHQRPKGGLFGGLWGPTYLDGEHPLVDGQLQKGVVHHSLSHRAITVHVRSQESTKSMGTNPEEVALSVLDHKILRAVFGDNFFADS